MLAVNPISSVRFGDSPVSALDREGAFSKNKVEGAAASTAPANASQVPEKKSSTGKKVVGTIVGLAVVAAALAALPKVFPNAIKALSKEELAAKPGFMKKVGHYVATVGNAIAKYTYEPVVNLFKKKPPKTDGNDASIATRIFA